MSSDNDREKIYKIGLIITPTENLYPKAACCVSAERQQMVGHVADKDHLFGNKIELSDPVPKYVKQGNMLWNLQA